MRVVVARDWAAEDMIDLARTALLAVLATGLGILVWWLIIPTEGVYLGRRMVIWLYDRFADRYDRIKRYDAEYEHWFLATPLLHAIAPHRSPLVLDVATGTGRMPLALMDHEDFHGRVIGVDLSREMLRRAGHKLAPYGDRVALLWCPAEDLPFADSSFDVVTCLEALEFTSDSKAVVKELVRILRPGGLLLITNRINTRLMPGRIWSDEQVHTLLGSSGIEHISPEVWQMDYKKVWGLKTGESPVVGARPLAEVLCCPRCRESLMIEQDAKWVCANCGAQASVGRDRVIELASLYKK
jgi:ubiquinone/menaquinone biosynthesis C-methylase UbiE